MSHLTPTINCSKINLVNYLLDMLELTAGMALLWAKSGFPKVVLKIFRWMSSWHHRWRIWTPDQIPQEDQSLQEDQNPQLVKTMLVPVLMRLTCRETTRNMNMSVTPQIIMFINPQTSSLHIHMSTLIPLLLRELHWLQCHLSHMVLAGWWTLCHPFRCGWWRNQTNHFCGSGLQMKIIIWRICWGPEEMLDRTQANDWWNRNISHVLTCLLWWNHWTDEISIIFFKSEAYEMVSCTNSSAGWQTQKYWVGSR